MNLSTESKSAKGVLLLQALEAKIAECARCRFRAEMAEALRWTTLMERGYGEVSAPAGEKKVSHMHMHLSRFKGFKGATF